MIVDLNSQELQMICRALMALKKQAKTAGIPLGYENDLEKFCRQVVHLWSVIDVHWDRARKKEQQNDEQE